LTEENDDAKKAAIEKKNVNFKQAATPAKEK